MSREQLSEIYLDTLKYCKDLAKINNKNYEDTSLRSIKLKINRTEVPISVPKEFQNTYIEVLNQDVIKSIYDLHKEIKSNKILVLNLASKKKFGGGVKNGAMAQEEEIFRKTDSSLHNGEELYPLHLDEFVFTPGVLIVKDQFYNKIDPLGTLSHFDMLAMSALYNPVVVNGNLLHKDYDLTYLKIENIFKYAIYKSYKYLILGALGCGVFKNPPLVIIDIFNICLKKYNGYFERIIFSVKSIRDNNFELFNKHIIRFNK
jgi:uncharacterized protein (TIGR02452 family)